MRHFELLEPHSMEEASCLLADDGEARVIAGGTALLVLIKQGLMRPKTLINLKKLSEGSAIEYDPQQGLRIGALSTLYDVESSPVVRQHYPVLAEACHEVANIRIRHMATIGGNLAHADYQSDPPGVLLAYEASVVLRSAKGERSVRLSQFLRGLYETCLGPGEMIVAVTLPPETGSWHGRYLKFTTGSSEERPCAGVTALLRTEGQSCLEARLAVGAVSPQPVLLRRSGEWSRDQADTVFREMAEEAGASVDPIEDLRGSAVYKRHLVRVLSRRALAAAWEEWFS